MRYAIYHAFCSHACLAVQHSDMIGDKISDEKERDWLLQSHLIFCFGMRGSLKAHFRVQKSDFKSRKYLFYVFVLAAG